MASGGRGQKKTRPGLRLRFRDSLPGMFTCRESGEVEGKLGNLPAGYLKFYYSLSFLPEQFDPTRFLRIEWEPVGDVDNYASAWWSANFANWRDFIAEKTGEPGEDFPFWCLGIDFIPKGTNA